MAVPTDVLNALNTLKSTIFEVDNLDDFNAVALDLFSIHARHNPTYRSYIALLNQTNPTSWEEIPGLPIETFKHHSIGFPGLPNPLKFTSSGTTGSQPSRHAVAYPEVYIRSFLAGFEARFGPPEGYTFLFLLPNYLEREGSSLVFMAEELVKRGKKGSGFYLYNHGELASTLERLTAAREKSILMGVSFALLDFADAHPMPLPHTLIVETGGMKGRRKELIREELHQILHTAFDAPISSEYGMTELLSQAYTGPHGRFEPPPWMRVSAVETDDPLSRAPLGKTGLLKVIDLANLYSCPFLHTGDVGRCYGDGTFDVLGRFDLAEVRGCNLMIS